MQNAFGAAWFVAVATQMVRSSDTHPQQVAAQATLQSFIFK